MFLNWTPVCLFTLSLKPSMPTVINIYKDKILLFGKEGIAALNPFWLKIYAGMISAYIIYRMTLNWIIPHIFYSHYSQIFTRAVPFLTYTLRKDCFISFPVHIILRNWFLSPNFSKSFLCFTNTSKNHYNSLITTMEMAAGCSCFSTDSNSNSKYFKSFSNIHLSSFALLLIQFLHHLPHPSYRVMPAGVKICSFA